MLVVIGHAGGPVISVYHKINLSKYCIRIFQRLLLRIIPKHNLNLQQPALKVAEEIATLNGCHSFHIKGTQNYSEFVVR